MPTTSMYSLADAVATERAPFGVDIEKTPSAVRVSARRSITATLPPGGDLSGMVDHQPDQRAMLQIVGGLRQP